MGVIWIVSGFTVKLFINKNNRYFSIKENFTVCIIIYIFLISHTMYEYYLYYNMNDHSQVKFVFLFSSAIYLLSIFFAFFILGKILYKNEMTYNKKISTKEESSNNIIKQESIEK